MSRNDALASEKLRPILATCLLVVAVAYNGFGVYQLNSDRSEFGGVDLSRRWLDHRYVWQRQNPYDVLATSQGSATAGSRDASIDPEIGPLVDGGYPPWSFTTGFVLVPPVPWQAVRLYFSFLNLVALGIIGYWAYRLGRPLGRWQAVFLLGAASAITANLFSLSAGQYSIIVNSLLVASLLFYERRLDVPAGLALGIAMVKPQIAGLFFLAFLVKARWKIVLASIAYVVVASLLTSWWIYTDPIELSLQAWQASHQWLAISGYVPLKFIWLWDDGNRFAAGWTALIFLVVALVLMSLYRKRSILLLFVIAAVLGRMWTYHGFFDNTMLLFLLVYLGVASSVRQQSAISLGAMFLLVGATLWSPVTYSGHAFLPLQIAHVLIWLLGLLTVLSSSRYDKSSALIEMAEARTSSGQILSHQKDLEKS